MLKERFRFLFQTTKGLVLVAIAGIGLATAIFGMLSGPMAELGIRDVVVRLTGMTLLPAEREGRIVMLYHSIAMAVVAIETYIITGLIPMKERQRTTINNTVTIGYLLSMIFGLGFAYFGGIWIFHGLFIVGQTLVYFAGVLLAAALWPWKEEYKVKDPAYAHTKNGYDLERIAFFTMAVVTLGSALFGAVAGAYFGNGFESFLAEDVVRNPHKPVLQKAIIGHLHIMLSLIGIAITLVVGRWQDFKGGLHKWAMPFMIIGSIVLSLGAWSVTLFEWAHVIIYVGSTFAMVAALFFVIFSWDKLIRSGQAERGITKGNFFQKIRALVRDPLRFGVGWQMVFMNFTVSGVGLFMAAKLDDLFRVWPHREERIVLTGHWHILAALIATIILMYYADLAGLKGRVRTLFGWLVIISSDLAFGSMTIFEMKRLFVTEAEQQALVDLTMILTDMGLGLLLVVLCILMVWRLRDLFRKKGRWTQEQMDDLDASFPEVEQRMQASASSVEPAAEGEVL